MTDLQTPAGWKIDWHIPPAGPHQTYPVFYLDGLNEDEDPYPVLTATRRGYDTCVVKVSSHPAVEHLGVSLETRDDIRANIVDDDEAEESDWDMVFTLHRKRDDEVIAWFSDYDGIDRVLETIGSWRTRRS